MSRAFPAAVLPLPRCLSKHFRPAAPIRVHRSIPRHAPSRARRCPARQCHHRVSRQARGAGHPRQRMARDLRFATPHEQYCPICAGFPSPPRGDRSLSHRRAWLGFSRSRRPVAPSPATPVMSEWRLAIQDRTRERRPKHRVQSETCHPRREEPLDTSEREEPAVSGDGRQKKWGVDVPGSRFGLVVDYPGLTA